MSENIENEQNLCNIKTPMKLTDSQNNKVLTQNGITFSVRKILLESELQRKEEVWKEIERHWQHMKENGKAIQEHMARVHSSMAEERERKSAEKLASILAEEERIAEQEELKRKQEQQLQAQRNQEQKLKLEREVEEYRKKMKEKEELYEKVTALKRDFWDKYCELLALLTKWEHSVPNISVILSSYATRLTEINQQVDILDKEIQSGQLTSADLRAGVAVRHMNEILSSIKSELERTASQQEISPVNNAQTVTNPVIAAKPQEPEKVKVTLPQPVQVPQQTQVDGTNPVLTGGSSSVPHTTSTAPQGVDPTPQSTAPAVAQKSNLYQFVTKECLEIYIKSHQFLDNYRKSYNEFQLSPNTKKFRFECQKAINIPVNAISGVSTVHIRDKYTRLQSLLTGKATPNVLQHPQGPAFCKDTLAIKIVSQGETLVSSKPKMAFPIASVAVALWNDHPDFGELLLAHFHTVCPYTVPIFIPKTEGQSNEDYYKTMGYKYMEDGSVEKHDKFLKRMSGLMRLYAAITITTQRRGVTKPHPYGLQHAWRWLAAVLNTEPRPIITDLCATLILDMLEVAGNALWVAFPKQFYKLLLLLAEDYYPRMQKVGCIGGGPLVRLEEFLKKSLSKGSIPQPEGELLPKYW